MLEDIVIIGIGITPARAGKTKNLTHIMVECKDHPRACGKD